MKAKLETFLSGHGTSESSLLTTNHRSSKAQTLQSSLYTSTVQYSRVQLHKSLFGFEDTLFVKVSSRSQCCVRCVGLDWIGSASASHRQGASAAAGVKKERHSFPQSLLRLVTKRLSRSRTLPDGAGGGGKSASERSAGATGCCGSGAAHAHSERDERACGPQRPLSDQSLPGAPALKSIPTITLHASDGTELVVDEIVMLVQYNTV